MMRFQSISWNVARLLFVLFISIEVRATENTYRENYSTSYQEITDHLKNKRELSAHSLPMDIPELPHSTGPVSGILHTQFMERFNQHVRNCDLISIEEEFVNYLSYPGQTYAEGFPTSPPDTSSRSWLTALMHTPLYNQYIHALFHIQCVVSWNQLQKNVLQCLRYFPTSTLPTYVTIFDQNIQELLVMAYPPPEPYTLTPTFKNAKQATEVPQRMINQSQTFSPIEARWYQKLQVAHQFVTEALKTSLPSSTSSELQMHTSTSLQSQSISSLHKRFQEVFGTKLRKLPRYIQKPPHMITTYLAEESSEKESEWVFEISKINDKNRDDFIFEFDNEEWVYWNVSTHAEHDTNHT